MFSGIFVAGAPGTADAPLVSANDKPAAPNTGRVLLRRFRFEACSMRDMVEFLPYLRADVRPIDSMKNSTRGMGNRVCYE